MPLDGGEALYPPLQPVLALSEPDAEIDDRVRVDTTFEDSIHLKISCEGTELDAAKRME